MDKNIILLIDGNALVHRAFHGIPPLKTKEGLLVNGVYGFTNTILTAIKQFHPEYLAVAFDVGKKTFRNEKYKDYKANRVKAPQELYDQFPLVKEICKELNIPQFGIKNYEADDVIGTISYQLSVISYQKENNKLKTDNCELKTIIVTGDMDALQLVDKNVLVYSVSRGIKQAELFDREKVKEKYGFYPEKLVDYKGLRGDPSDNIPGVPGIGEKTAKKLISEFGTIEKIYEQISNDKCQITNNNKQLTTINYQQTTDNENIGKIKPKTVEILIKNKDEAILSKELATIKKDVPLDFQLRDAKISDYDPKKAKKILERFEFKSLISKLPEYKPNHSQKTLF